MLRKDRGFPNTISLRSRLIILMTTTSVILLLLFIAYTFFIVSGQVRERIQDQLDKSVSVASFILEEQHNRLKSLGTEVTEDETLQTVLTLGLTSKLRLYKENLKKRSGVSFVFFTDGNGRSVDWLSTFLSFGMKTGHPFIERAILGLSTTGYSLVKAGDLRMSDPYTPLKLHEDTPERELLVMVTAAPLTDIKGHINLIFVAGNILDMDISLMHKVKNLSGADWAIIRNRRFIAGSVMTPMGDVAYHSPIVETGIVETGNEGRRSGAPQLPPASGPGIEPGELLLKGENRYHQAGIGLSNYQDDILGRVIVMVSDKPFQALRKRLYATALLILAAGLGLSFAIAFFFSDRVIRPLKVLGGFTYRIAEGEKFEEIPVRRLDEIGQLTHDFNKMAAKLSEKRKKLDETNRHLVRMAHQSGMAEIAESVLHNIGNTINPISVRISRLNDKIGHRESQILGRILTMIMSEDVVPESDQTQKKRKEALLKLVSTTTDLLNNRNQVLKEELNFLGSGMNRILEILSLQQKYAGLQETDTRTDINALLKDATDILNNSFSITDITLECHFSGLPLIPVDKNRLMHVFMNILKNACESIKTAPPENKRVIRIHTSLESEKEKKWIKVAIANTGSGMLPGEIDKVFRINLGFHEAANYIKSLNGSVTLSSKGPGKGACVSLKLPVPGIRKHKEFTR